MNRILATLLACASLAPWAVATADTLDPGFAGSGIQVYTAPDAETRVLGACPLAGGGVGIVAYRNAPREWIVVRARVDGTLDPSFSGDGVQTIASSIFMREQPAAVTCVGAGNTNAQDDAMLVAAPMSHPSYPQSHLLLAMVNLDQGTLAWSGAHDLNAWMFGWDPETGEANWYGLNFHGVFPGANGEWLVVGASNHGDTMRRGIAARFSAGGALLQTYAIPEQEGVRTLDVHVARVIVGGEIRALARVETAGRRTWGLLRLATANLALLGTAAVGGPEAADYALFKGRFIAGGGFVVPAMAPSTAPSGQTPHLLVIRGNTVADVVLPQPAAFGPEITLSGGPMAATVAANGRVIVAMGLSTPTMPGVGYYAALVKLGNGETTLDAVDTGYGSQGSDFFQYAPPTAQSLCPPGTVPPQHFANISSWGNTTVLVGNAAPRCYDENNNDFGTSTWVLAARIQSDSGNLFGDGFE